MRGGAFHNIITFERHIETRTSDNIPGVRWLKAGEAFAEAKTRNARTFRENGQFYERQVTEFFCRFFDAMNVEQSWRIKFKGQTYKITGIFPDHERNNHIRFETEHFNETSRS
jgi:SPP1 family predicted phage head-tail adaptor